MEEKRLFLFWKNNFAQLFKTSNTISIKNINTLDFRSS